MSTPRKAYLAAVLVGAIALSIMALSDAGRIAADRVSGEVLTGVAGQARDLDAAQVQQLIRRRLLSDHEAQFYKPLVEPRADNGTEAGRQQNRRVEILLEATA